MTRTALSAFLGLLLGTGAVAEEDFSDPRVVVESFIQDHYRWNNESQAAAEKQGAASAMAQARAEYQRLIVKYCKPGYSAQPISFGGDPSHTPAEVIEEVRATDNTAVVVSSLTAPLGNITFTSRYEYHLEHENGRWHLEHIFYLIDGKKYEGL